MLGCVEFEPDSGRAGRVVLVAPRCRPGCNQRQPQPYQPFRACQASYNRLARREHVDHVNADVTVEPLSRQRDGAAGGSVLDGVCDEFGDKQSQILLPLGRERLAERLKCHARLMRRLL